MSRAGPLQNGVLIDDLLTGAVLVDAATFGAVAVINLGGQITLAGGTNLTVAAVIDNNVFGILELLDATIYGNLLNSGLLFLGTLSNVAGGNWITVNGGVAALGHGHVGR